MAEKLWVVRAGRKARFAHDFLDGSYIAISFREFAPEDLSTTSEDVIKARAGTRAEQSHARQLTAFAHTIDVGDLVIVPRLTAVHRDYLVARVTGPYRHVAEVVVEGDRGPGIHRRSVEWMGSFARDSLSLSASKSLNGRPTMFRPSSGEADLRTQFKALDAIDP